MRLGQWLQRNLPTFLFMAVALPWLSLFALGLVWLWQGGRVWVWALGGRCPGTTGLALVHRATWSLFGGWLVGGSAPAATTAG
jgi:hypothetical protein